MIVKSILTNFVVMSPDGGTLAHPFNQLRSRVCMCAHAFLRGRHMPNVPVNFEKKFFFLNPNSEKTNTSTKYIFSKVNLPL
jgi:hypothetical protein